MDIILGAFVRLLDFHGLLGRRSVSVGSFGIVYTKYSYICVIAIPDRRWDR